MPTRPPFRIPGPIKSCGVYVGFAVDPKVDFDKVGLDLYNAGYNKCSVFLSTAFNNCGLWPWPNTGNIFQFGTINQAYFEHLYHMLERFCYYRISPHLCFVDQFHSLDDSPNDPFRQLFHMQDWDEEPLYSSYDAKTQKKWWLDWDEPKPGVYTNYRVFGSAGMPLQRYVRNVCQTVQKVYDLYPDSRFSWKWGNETMAFVDPQSGHVVNTRSRGDRDEAFLWVRQQFSLFGLNEGPRLKSYVDYSALIGGLKKSISYPTVANAFHKGIRGKLKSQWEIHGILSLGDIQAYISQCNIDPAYTLWSTDGDLRMEATYTVLGHSPYHTDLKFDIKAGQPWDKQNMMHNWNTYFPGHYDKYVKNP